MYADLSDHPFSPESVARELGPDASELAWLAWIARAEKLIGHSLDGNDVNESGCGYSLDDADEACGDGLTPAEYVAEVRSRARYDGGAFVAQ